jgi:hypothetical protein
MLGGQQEASQRPEEGEIDGRTRPSPDRRRYRTSGLTQASFPFLAKDMRPRMVSGLPLKVLLNGAADSVLYV